MANETPEDLGKKSSGVVRAAVWVAGSALFGSLALVLWNRRVLRSMRETPEFADPPMLNSDDDIY